MSRDTCKIRHPTDLRQPVCQLYDHTSTARSQRFNISPRIKTSNHNCICIPESALCTTHTHTHTHKHTQARTHAHTLSLLHTHIYHTHTARTLVLSLTACTKLAENSEIGIESLSQALNSQLPPVPTLHRHPPPPPHTLIHTLARLPVFSSPRQQHMSACAPLLPPPSLRIL